MAGSKICSIDGCNKKVFCRGWCSAHYHRWQRYGNPEEGFPLRGVQMRWLLDKRSHDGDDCLIWPFARSGDGRAGSLFFRGKQTNAARIMCHLVNGDPPSPRDHAAHSCGKGHLACVNPRHLRWASPKQNQLDRFLHGTGNHGSRNHHNVISEEDAATIKQLIPLVKGRMTHGDVAKLFGVKRSTVALIAQGRTWKWLNAQSRK